MSRSDHLDDAPLAQLDRVTVAFGLHHALSDISLTIRPGQHWAIVGPNGAGKTILSEVIAGTRTPVRGTVAHPALSRPAQEVRAVSFERQMRLLAEEQRHDDSWLMHGAIDEGSTVVDLVRSGAPQTTREMVVDWLDQVDAAYIADRGLRFLSSGETRKAILCAAFLARPRVLILDDPFDGLDVHSCGEFSAVIDARAHEDTTLVFVLGRADEVPACVSHVAVLDAGRLVAAGPRAEALPRAPHHRRTLTGEIPHAHGGPSLPAGSEVVSMNGVEVRYGERLVLSEVNWQARAGECWQIAGPNGSGKSSLLSMIDGSNPKAYGQPIALFGRPRGSGESIWQIKQRIGLVSPAFHTLLPRHIRAFEAILTGFEDSAVLCRRPNGLEQRVADEWLELLGLSDRGATRLGHLSYGEQRAVLVARAMVKLPQLLIADEPNQGLDDDHAQLVLDLLAKIARETTTCVLYVSHEERYALPYATHRLELIPAESEGNTARVVELAG